MSHLRNPLYGKESNTPLLIEITSEVEKCLQTGCYFAALMVALTLPDICGKAEFPDIPRVKRRYIGWYDEYVGKYENSNEPGCSNDGKMHYLSGEVVYSLRNAMLHQGTPNIDTDEIKEDCCKIDEFVLVIDNAMAVNIKSVTHDDDAVYRTYEVNIVEFCSKLVRVAMAYYKDNQENFNFFKYRIIGLRTEVRG